jgi:superfamily II DNA or RNA helicase
VPEPGPALTDPERLTLLQLLTRRAMEQRQERFVDAGSEEEEESDSLISLSPVLSPVPGTWRLIPENTTLYDWQRDCLPIWMSQGRGTIKVATAGGKTLFALAAAERIQNEREPYLQLVVVVPTIPLMHQWRAELQASNLPSYSIELLGGGHQPRDLANVRILISVLNSARDQLPAIVTKAAWAERMMLVVDECHRSNAEKARKVFMARPKYTLGLSATPEQDGGEGIPSNEAYAASPVGQALGPIIYDFSLRAALEAGLLTPFEVWHVGLALAPEEAARHDRLSREITELRKSLQAQHRKSPSKQDFLAWCQTVAKGSSAGSEEAARFVSLASERKRLLYRARARLGITLRILDEASAQAEGRSIVFHESIDEVERLFLHALSLDLPAVLEHSRLPDGVRAENIEAFRSGLARTIISAKSLVEGFNVPSADLGIIAASSGSARQRIQSLGRLLRRKPNAQSARVIVLYVRDTQDESIYQKADWEQVIGAERNRYFHWSDPGEGVDWGTGLQEQEQPPRAYRPPSGDVDVRGLASGEPYPGRADGTDLRVDATESLRTEDGRLVAANPVMIHKILDLNSNRRAHRTAAGHAIVRTEAGRDKGESWLYLGSLPEPENGEPVLRYKLHQSSGRRRIGRQEQAGRTRFSLGPGRAHDARAGQATDALLQWIQSVEQEHGLKVKELCWDGRGRYWVEVRGEKIEHPGELPQLEFTP